MSARAGHLAVAFLSGFCVITVEFAAVRQLAPAFGQSITVWSTVIGIILVALALGYAAGGRLGERSRSARPLFGLYVIAALWLVGVSLAGPALCRALIPQGLPEGGLPLGFTGSLVASLLLFVVPTVVMGMTSPFLIRLDARSGSEGRTTGGIYAVGTLGSLSACFLAPLVLLQTAGTADTLRLVAAILGAMGGIGVFAAGRGPAELSPPPAAQPGEPVGRGFLAVALLTGLAVTIIEFGAVRFMGPWVGQSNFIWATVIGVCLLALAMGSWLGGRWADAVLSRGAVGGRHFYVVLALAAAWIGGATLAAPALLEWLVPQGIESMQILPIAFRASMVATVLFFGPPLVLLGTAPPFLVRMATRGDHAGRTAGVLFAWTTVGGLIGCFVTSPLLVPAVGARGTLLLAALGLVAIAAVALRPSRWRAAGATLRPATLPLVGVLGLVPLALLVVHFAGRAPLREQPGQVIEIESAYQTIRVVRKDVALMVPFLPETAVPALLGDDGSAMTVFLRHDEDAETYQSIILEDPETSDAWLTGGRYFEHMALGAHFARRDPKRLRVLIIGHAGGTVYRTLMQSVPEGVSVTALGVEIDGAVIDVARDHLRHREIEGEALELITGEDARTVVNALPADRVFDLVLVDAYARTNYLPFQLATTEFFQAVREHLAPDGWIGVNVLGDGMKSPVANAVANTMVHALGSAYAAPNPSFPGNVILWAPAGGALLPRLQTGTRLHPGMQAAAFAFERLTVRHVFDAKKGLVLTDDLSPSDRLADEELGL